MPDPSSATSSTAPDSDRSRPAGWLRQRAAALETIEPDGPLDDLEPLRVIIGGARVVAVGESAHFVREFNDVKRRVVRFLAERCGFTVVAMEYGFSEAYDIDPWVQGAGDDDDLARISPMAVAWGSADLLHGLRGYNRTAERPLRFVGLDTPSAGGSLLPALVPLIDELRDADPDALPTLEAAIRIAERLGGGSVAAASPRWARLDPGEQDRLTAGLARLVLRAKALEPLYVPRLGRGRYDIAVRRLEAAAHADYMLRAMTGLFTGTGLAADPSVRDRFVADSVRWHIERSAPGTRIALVAHNNHIQKTPAVFDGQLASLPMGQYLDRELGDDYRALAVTSTADRIPEMALDEAASTGFTLTEVTLSTPEPGSVEAAAGPGPCLVDLRSLEPSEAASLDRIRTQSASMQTPLADAFDGVFVLPTATIDPTVTL